MGQVLHGSAKTTHAVRALIQRSKASNAALKPSKKAHSMSGIRLRAKLTSHAEMILNHSRPRRETLLSTRPMRLAGRDLQLRRFC